MSKRPKIALCFPNFAWQVSDASFQWHMLPHSLCILAAMVRDVCEVDIIDAYKENMSRDGFAERLGSGKYDLVGISVLMDLFSRSGQMAVSLAKKTLPNCVTIMGGVYATMNPGDAMKNPDLDFVCIGEGEEAFPALIRHLFLGGERPREGFAYRNGEEVAVQARARFVQDLDNLPPPAYDLIDFSAYANWNQRKTIDDTGALPCVTLFTSRGCPQSCCFCQAAKIAGHRVRAKSPEKVLEEMTFFKNVHGVRSIVFADENLLAIRPRAEAIFKGMIERGLAMPWFSAVASFNLDEELLALMKESGCVCINPAVESGSPRVLREIIHKPVNLTHTKRIVKAANAMGIFTIANFIVGFPGETWEEIRETLRFAEELEAGYVKIFAAIPLRHTELWEVCERENAFAPGFCSTETSWNQGQIVSPHFDARELTLLRAYEWDRINFSTPEKRARIAERMGVGAAELDAIRRDTRKLALSRM
ncbi:MAG: B12-binding domain-containing radical SAM protein [Planctomycetota bacterium]|nr:B12-binding domain-containing radical SAM protein [Planctomycetota bacterium]